MAQKRRSSKRLDKKKKRKWYSIYAPKEFGNAELGESFVSSPENLIGKNVKVNLSRLTKVKNSNIRVKFTVKEVKEEKALTEPTSYEILPNFLNRIVRKNKTKIVTSQKLKTKDNTPITIKTVIITRSKIKGGTSTELRNQVVAQIEETIKKNNFDKILDSIIKYEFQKNLKEAIRKIAPIQTIEVKYFSK